MPGIAPSPATEPTLALETQDSVFAWCEQAYPGEDIAKKVVNLIEEATELALVLGVPENVLLRTVRLTVQKSNDPVGDLEWIQTEVGDTQLSLFNLAGSLGLDTGTALGRVMQRNRARSLAESAERAARKEAIGLTGEQG